VFDGKIVPGQGPRPGYDSPDFFEFLTPAVDFALRSIDYFVSVGIGSTISSSFSASPMAPQKVTPFLWFNSQAEDAAAFYVSLFPNSRICGSTPGPNGTPLVVEFELDGVRFLALNGGPHYQLNEAFSLSVSCDSQLEIDSLWDRLSEGGSHSQCGWLKDRFGLSWQVVPSVLPKLMADPSGRVMQALMKMNKLEIQPLQDAYDGK
jgi:predicted 3-demethylubiquinone-9 3-methyltransferase (glyoxalase superfamily)